MYIKQVLQNGDYSILDLYCYSCNSKEHLIENCPQITYQPNREKILIQERIGEQCRQSFHRDTTVNHRLNNKVLRRLNANNESLYRFQLQERIITEDELSNNQLIDSSFNEPSEKMLANISNNRVLEQKQQTENNQSKEITRGLQLAYTQLIFQKTEFLIVFQTRFLSYFSLQNFSHSRPQKKIRFILRLTFTI